MNGLFKSLWLGLLLALGIACSSDDTTDQNASTNAGRGPISPAAASGGASGGTTAGTAASSTAGGVSTVAPRAGTSAPAGTGATLPPPRAGVAAPPPAQAGAAAPPPAAGSGMPATPPPVPNGPPVPSTGCGAAMPPPPSGNMSIDVDGTQRDYIIKVPANYDAKKPYKLVFAWHGLGGTAMSIAGGFGGGYYGQAQRSGDTTIFIAGQGLPTSGTMGMEGGAGWPNTGGRDVAFVRKLVDWVTTNYCIDRSRIFSVGMSYGGIMSNTLGCQMGDVFRAIAPMSGSGPRAFGGSQCVNHVAAWLSHGNTDTVVQFSAGQGSRDHWVQANHCTMQTMPTEPSPCVAYQGCDAGYPVTWCEFDGGHTVPPFASDAIFKFFSQF